MAIVVVKDVHVVFLHFTIILRYPLGVMKMLNNNYKHCRVSGWYNIVYYTRGQRSKCSGSLLIHGCNFVNTFCSSS